MSYLRYKLWHSSEIKPHKKADLDILPGKKLAFDGLEKVPSVHTNLFLSYYSFKPGKKLLVYRRFLATFNRDTSPS